MRLDIKATAITAAIVWGALVFFITWWIIFLDGATGEPTLIAKVYRGYSISAVGSLIGLAWALVDGLVVGALFAWLYNRFARSALQHA